MTKAPFEWSDLRHFLAVARSGKLTEAARRLKVEHSTVSRRLAALEHALGARLFDKEPGGYKLTADGEKLLPSAESMEAIALASQSHLADSNRSVSGTVRIGAPDGFGSHFLAPRLEQLAKAHPDLEIQLIALPRIFNLTKREADIAIGLSRPKEKRLHGDKLTDYRLRMYAAPSYLVKHPPIRSIATLSDHDFIGYVDDLIYAPELDYLRLAAKDIRAMLKSSTLVAQLEMTLAGAGICILPDFLARRHQELKCVLPNQVELTRTFWLLVHADIRNLARVRVVSDFITTEVQKERKLFG
ncbi:LysR family transcriptional regulator [Bradyrhizobium sp. LHD-71]|uniref:LysR family transcriptional regulator n=1 Tax=Bradyrhizobium sp. LHD-71 TaxID=3072141 RepID=UPI00280D2044|nr:LysR family transcriptional regulator [Bradyrhizobium sp. LHD-71]MDQ8732786.1 LysR family transcriptional regulator [Bradyrhizobium sp. LHD-71]